MHVNHRPTHCAPPLLLRAQGWSAFPAACAARWTCTRRSVTRSAKRMSSCCAGCKVCRRAVRAGSAPAASSSCSQRGGAVAQPATPTHDHPLSLPPTAPDRVIQPGKLGQHGHGRARAPRGACDLRQRGGQPGSAVPCGAAAGADGRAPAVRAQPRGGDRGGARRVGALRCAALRGVVLSWSGLGDHAAPPHLCAPWLLSPATALSRLGARWPLFCDCEQVGGWVTNGRVCDVLAVSRAFGDRDFKGDGLEGFLQQGVR